MSSGKPPSYATRFARRITETNPDVTIISMLRPGYDNGNGKKSQGNTNGRRDHYTAANIDAVAKAVQNLAVHHNASRTIVVGHSGGAATAALIAGRHPDILDGMVLISCRVTSRAGAGSATEATGQLLSRQTTMSIKSVPRSRSQP
jgi:pimeloyl-ACP methyl ester carboxylesterase